jgi:hypothetical protein
MAMSFAAAVQADGRILAESQAEEESASEDRIIARQWMDGAYLVLPMVLSQEQRRWMTRLAKLQMLYVSGLEVYYYI